MNQIVIRRRYAETNSLLPSEYKLAEYIESTGSVCINTNIKPNVDTHIKIDFIFYNNNKNLPTIIDFRTGSGNNYTIRVSKQNGNLVIRFSTIDYTTIPDESRHTVEIVDKKVYFDENQIIDGSSAGEFNIAGNKNGITLFGRTTQNQNAPATDCYSLARIYELTIDEHQLLPCMKKSNQQYGLYDTATGTFFGNDNLTGQLI